MNTLAQLTEVVAGLREDVASLRAEAAIRRLQARYMFLCDTPCPDPDVTDVTSRIARILDLYTEDAVWEGVGPLYDAQFGRMVGKAAIGRHFEQFWSVRQAAMIFNTHYLTSEHIVVEGDQAEGRWLHMQPWIFDDGSSILRSSHLSNLFRLQDDEWKISRTRTQGVFTTDLPKRWATYSVTDYIIDGRI